MPQQNQNVTSFLLDSQHSQLSVNQNKQNGQTFGEKVKLTEIFNCLGETFNNINLKNSDAIAIPRSGLLYVDKLARVLAT